MALKHLAFHDVDREAWLKSQRRWLELSAQAGGLRSAWAAVARSDARMVFDWESEDALKHFMEQTHERALSEAGTVGRAAVLYLDPLVDLGSRGEATFVGESIAWVKESGVDAWMESQRTWNEAMRRCDGFVGGSIARGRRIYVVTSFWRDAGAHRAFVERIVPDLRGRTSGDAHVARLVRFQGEIIGELCR
jgi:heme-degrading monooxygenase HmoA